MPRTLPITSRTRLRRLPARGVFDRAAIDAILDEHIVSGRWAEVRPPSVRELKATTVLALPLTEASAKVRSGPPKDEEEDYSRDVWAGVIPLRLAAGEPETDPRVPSGVAIPNYARFYRRSRKERESTP